MKKEKKFVSKAQRMANIRGTNEMLRTERKRSKGGILQKLKRLFT